MSTTPLKLRIVSVEAVADDVVSVVFESMARLPLPEWDAGAHIEVKLPSGLVRHYSLCGDVDDRSRYRIGVLREENGRGGSKEMHEVCRPGTVMQVRAPRNNFPLEPAGSYLFLGGGIGITPLLPMIQRAEAAGVPWRLVYGGRSRSHMAFVDRLLEQYGDRVAVFADDAEGRPDLAGEVAAVDADALVYACGPGPMLDVVVGVCDKAGRADRLRLERFLVAAVDTSGEPFDVELARTGIAFTVGADETILQGALARGVAAPFSCENGYCGTCEAVVLDGQPDHRDTYLTDEEKEDSFTMMICVSRCAGGKLVLDL
ncbi:MAG: PDR/VanB family oxidoreductase [Microbacterium sp.]